MNANKIVLNSHFEGTPQASNFRIAQVEIQDSDFGEEDVIVKLILLSVDPAVLHFLNTLQVGDSFGYGGIGEVIRAGPNSQFNQGDIVSGYFHWQDIALVKNGAGLSKIDTSDRIPLEKHMSLLGYIGLTAYHGLMEICDPKPGETMVVSAAAGAVGSVVGQIGKIKGCKVIGFAGSDDKCKLLVDELGFDAAINYKTCGSMKEALDKHCPGGVDIFFDNVGGSILEAVLMSLKKGARISICGQVSSYNKDKNADLGPRLYVNLIEASATIKGFGVLDYQHKFPESLQILKQWYLEGKLKTFETVREGELSEVPLTFLEMLRGGNTGKMIHRLL